MKKKTNKLIKLEKNRYSIITDNLEECFICHRPKDHLHEVFYGNNRINSMKYGCVIPICSYCHSKVHNNIQLDLKLKKMLKRAFLEYYKCDEDYFINIFHINYI